LTSAAATSGRGIEKFKDTYFAHSQGLAVYGNPKYAPKRTAVDSFVQDSLLFDVENLEISSSLDLSNRSRCTDKPLPDMVKSELNLAHAQPVLSPVVEGRAERRRTGCYDLHLEKPDNYAALRVAVLASSWFGFRVATPVRHLLLFAREWKQLPVSALGMLILISMK
jgi:hypothetical protein